MTNEVTTPENNQVSTHVSKGIAGEFSRDDVNMGRISIMQANSELVKNGEQRLGAVVDLTTGVELAFAGNKKEPAKDLHFMIFGLMKYWVVKDADTKEFIEKFPANSPNELAWDEVVNGRSVKRTFHFSYLVLLPEEIEMGAESPYELAFRSTAVKDTKRLNSLIAKMEAKGKSSNMVVFKAGIETKVKDGDSWLAFKLGIERDATEQEEKVCTEYFNNFVATKEKFMKDNRDFEGKEGAAPKESDY